MAERVAGVHADMVNQHIKKLNCPSDQKVQLLDAVIKSASIEKAGEQTLLWGDWFVTINASVRG